MVGPASTAGDKITVRVQPHFKEDRKFKAKEWQGQFKPTDPMQSLVQAYERSSKAPGGCVGTQWYHRGRRIKQELTLSDNKIGDGSALDCFYLRKVRQRSNAGCRLTVLPTQDAVTARLANSYAASFNLKYYSCILYERADEAPACKP